MLELGLETAAYSPMSAMKPGQNAGPLVQVKGLTIIFPTGGRRVSVVDHLDFSVVEGHTLGIVGESGSGKTMTALALLGMVPSPGQVVAGEIWFRGRDLLASLDAWQGVRGSQIAMVFQDPYSSLNPFYRIGVQMTHALQAHQTLTKGEARDRAIALLCEVELPEPERRLDDYPLQLSGGMRQRVMIALALANRPVLLLADEPTSSLDVTIQAQILKLLAELQRTYGMTMIFISHDLAVVSQVADEVLVMYAGQVMERGSIADIFEHPQHPYTRGLLATLPSLGSNPPRLPIVPGSLPPLTEMGQGCRFASRCPHRMAICETVKPPPTRSSPSHTVHCYLYGGD